ncbi:MAG: serine phosphatase [Bryobacterales bacterium]|nr:serine phosphatase [Bryobacterales bacterium]
MHTSPWRHYRNYIFLLPLFAIALVYQITYTAVAIRVTAHATTTPSRPFASAEQMVTGVDRQTARAGLHAGDRAITINGRRFTGDHVLMEEIWKVGPTQKLRLTIVPRGTNTIRTVEIPPRFWDDATADGWRWALTATLLAMMFFCSLVGVYVAAVLPHDIRALTVFGLMTATSQLIAFASWYHFPRSLWVFADVLHMYGAATWPTWLILFSLYFPHRFSWDVRRPGLKWLLLAPLLVWTGLEMAGAISEFSRFGALANVAHAVDFRILTNGGLFAFSVVLFFVSILAKISESRDPDSCRRLRILFAGSLFSLVPIVGLVLYQAWNSTEQFNKVSETVVIGICFLFCVFPATLAYVVVVERAMRLQMVVRQGVRYALAKGGLGIVIALIATGVFTVLGSVIGGSSLSLPVKIALMVGSVVSVSWIIRGTRKRIMLWLDRRFFRESYDAERLLQDLGETVQSILDQDHLLDTVARRISQTLHVPHVAVLLNGDGAFRPVYCLGFPAMPQCALPEESKTLDVVKHSKEPARIYFDRRDNWVHSASPTEVATLRSIHAQLLLPLGSKQKTAALLSLGPKRSEEPYTSSDVQLLRTVALQTGLALENSRLACAVAKEMVQREKLNREIEIAREVQERLFPQSLPPIAGIDYFGACRPALGVGGDYYDFLPLANGNLGVAIGDVSGKGIAAALLMASLQASLRGQAMMNQGDLACLMSNVNQLVFDATPINRYATFFYGQYNRASRVFTYVNAGHNPPIVLRRTVDVAVHVIRLETGGPVVGLFPGAPYQQGTLIMEPGDIFVGFTDGISEAMNESEEEWGEERLIPAIVTQSDYRAAEMIPALMAEADRFVNGAPQHDDMTLVVMKMAVAA